MSVSNKLSGGVEHVRQSRIVRRHRKLLKGGAFALPYLIVFGVFLLYPLFRGLYMSLFAWDPFFPEESTFIWFDNYLRMVQDPRFWNATVNTVYFVVLTVPTMVVFALGLALGVNRNLKGGWLLRTVFFSPYILTVSVVALLWIELYVPGYGALHSYLDIVVADPPAFLDSRVWAMPAIALATVWWTIGFNFIILLTARQNVPEHLYEAARLDGANAWNAFRDITLPQMRHALVFVVIVQFIASFQVFGQPYIMTGGGPGTSTETLVMYLYTVAFNQQDFGYAVAIGYFLFAVLTAVSLANYYLIGGNDE